jgi:hypothetical protein
VLNAPIEYRERGKTKIATYRELSLKMLVDRAINGDSVPPSWLSQSWVAPSGTAIRASIQFWWRIESPTIRVRPPTGKAPNSRPRRQTRRVVVRGELDGEDQLAMSVRSPARGRRISLGPLHLGQLKAYWSLQELSPIFGDGLKDQAAAVWD